MNFFCCRTSLGYILEYEGIQRNKCTETWIKTVLYFVSISFINSSHRFTYSLIINISVLLLPFVFVDIIPIVPIYNRTIRLLKRGSSRAYPHQWSTQMILSSSHFQPNKWQHDRPRAFQLNGVILLCNHYSQSTLDCIL